MFRFGSESRKAAREFQDPRALPREFVCQRAVSGETPGNQRAFESPILDRFLFWYHPRESRPPKSNTRSRLSFADVCRGLASAYVEKTCLAFSKLALLRRFPGFVMAGIVQLRRQEPSSRAKDHNRQKYSASDGEHGRLLILAISFRPGSEQSS